MHAVQASAARYIVCVATLNCLWSPHKREMIARLAVADFGTKEIGLIYCIMPKALGAATLFWPDSDCTCARSDRTLISVGCRSWPFPMFLSSIVHCPWLPPDASRSSPSRMKLSQAAPKC
jgi:hypothetical protein